MHKKKILFLGESYRADAITWMNGLREFGNFEIITWELKTPSDGFFNRIKRILEFVTAPFSIHQLIRSENPDMVIAERTTSYGFLAALTRIKPIAIAQQGRTDLWPEHSVLLPLKILIQDYAFKNATLIHAWGPIMTVSMKKANVDMSKVLVLAKGINLDLFDGKNISGSSKIKAIVTRSLLPEYSHATILKAFGILHQKQIDFELTVVGDGTEMSNLKVLAEKLNIADKVIFKGRIANTQLPQLLKQANFYISMPITEGVSASLFEAMASNCCPIVTAIPGNESWIKHRENGHLIPIDDHKMLADEIIWSFENSAFRTNVIAHNRLFVEKNADYKINMKIIADQYHQLINLSNSK